MKNELPVWAWIGGWGCELDLFERAVSQRWPEYRHVVVAPTERAVEEVSALEIQRVGGYSLGSLLLLEQWERFQGVEGVMLAPFFGFCQEMNLGGSVPRKELLQMRMLLKMNAKKALRSFMEFVELDFEVTGFPYPKKDLEWGLLALSERFATGDDFSGVRVVVGREDKLIDVERLQELCEKRKVPCQAVKGAGHDYRGLI